MPSVGTSETQPLSTVVLTRPFGWGIVIVNDPALGGEVPDVDPNRLVTASDGGLIALVRHSQDVDSFEDDFAWAEATVEIRHLTKPLPDPAWRTVYSGVLLTPSGRLLVGDADDEVMVATHPGSTRVEVFVLLETPDDDPGPEHIRLDLLPAD